MQRLDLYMEAKGLNDNKLTILAGLSVGLLGKARKRKGVMSSDNIEKILLACPDLNANWLLTGQGKMIFGIDILRKEDISNPEMEKLLQSINKEGGAINQLNQDHQEMKMQIENLIKSFSQ